MTHQPDPRPTLGLAALLAFLSMVSPFALDTFFPSFPAIAQQFSLSALQLQQTLTAYLLPYGLTMLLHGPLSDAYGRRRVILIGVSLFALASLACAFAPSFGWLLAFRAVQGATAGAGMVVSRAIVRDLYSGHEAQRLMSLMTMLFGFAPAIAPVIGGWVHVAFGWRAVFIFLVLLGATITFVAWWRLPETHPPERRFAFQFRSLITISWRIVSHREFLLLALSTALHFVSVVAYIGAAPAIVLEQWGLTETQFAMLFVPLIGGFVAGAFTSGRMAGRLSPHAQTRLGFLVSAIGGLLSTLALWLFSPVPIIVQQVLIFTAAYGVQIVSPIITLRLLDLYPDTRGAVSSVQSFVSIMVAAFTMGVVVPALHGSLLLLALGSLVGALVGWSLWRMADAAPAR
ncbi:MAG TPA: multidrug effflux MFS transporter [Steroidobacteraceae bacterium]|nr:multidrug effflux MFS transporter [Steroidobacteraceae bacterium]HNS26594.1 multidrug effflux MFS transporter [Steroidobacteraceae bacterium]